MQKFTTKIVNMMKAEKLYETQGGPIILSQVVKMLSVNFLSHYELNYQLNRRPIKIILCFVW